MMKISLPRRKEMIMTVFDKKWFTVRNDKTGRSYPVLGRIKTTLDIVWMSERCWFSTGARVTISDEEGHSKTFIKE